MKEWLRLFQKSFEAWNEDKALRLSAALAYYSIFSIAPLLVITIAISGLVLGKEAATGQLYESMSGFIGGKAAAGVESMVESASKPTSGIIATIVGVCTLLFGASGVLGQLKDALNTIWEVEIKKGVGIVYLLRANFLNFGMVLVIGLLLLISLILSSWLAALDQRFQAILALPAWVWTVATSLVSFGVATALFALLFKFLPDARVRWRDVWIGAAVTALLFELGKMGLGWYLGREGSEDAYGTAGSVVLLILWVYYASCILLFGAEFTQVYTVARGRPIEAGPNARLASEVQREQEHAAAADATRKLEPLPRPGAEGVSHNLIGRFLKYLEGWGMLLYIEAKEALQQTLLLVILAATCTAALVIAWILLAVYLIGLLTSYYALGWMTAVIITFGIHLLLAIVTGLLIWTKARRGVWFAECFNQLKGDRSWLKGQ